MDWAVQEPVLAAEAERLGFEYIQVSDLKADNKMIIVTTAPIIDSEGNISSVLGV